MPSDPSKLIMSLKFLMKETKTSVITCLLGEKVLKVCNDKIVAV